MKKLNNKVNKNTSNEIINFYDVIPTKYKVDVDNPNYDLHNIKLPFRMCIVAPSGSGKTNFLLNLLKVFSKGKGTFVDVHIITANKDEPLYNYLEGEFDGFTIKEGLSSSPKLDSFDKKYNHLIIWDDLVLSKDIEKLGDYFIRARKLNCSLIFLSQKYTKIPTTIRTNSNYLVLFDLGGSKRETNYILNEWAGDLDKDELRAIYNDAVSKELQPLIITGGKIDKNKKYRKGWLDYYNLDNFLRNIPRTLPSKIKKHIKVDEASDSDD
jgi:ABC-type dipeptide/oligopeptide/nickel transport system ATPase component